MNRLTKQISLVLISSALVLHGCERPSSQVERNRLEVERKLKQEQELQEGGASFEDPPSAGASDTSSTQTSHNTGHRRGFFFIPWVGGRSVGGGSMGVRSGSSGTPTGSSSAGSVRGGFGGSAHSVSS